MPWLFNCFELKVHAVRILIFSVGCVLLMSGCSGGSDRPDTVPVRGTITLDGKPLADATVSFSAETERPATGTSDSFGEFTLTTFESEDGAIPGEYKVTVEKYEVADNNDPYAERKSLVPLKYVTLNETPLTQSITAEGEPLLLIELNSE